MGLSTSIDSVLFSLAVVAGICASKGPAAAKLRMSAALLLVQAHDGRSGLHKATLFLDELEAQVTAVLEDDILLGKIFRLTPP
jgi:hypothetical protein